VMTARRDRAVVDRATSDRVANAVDREASASDRRPVIGSRVRTVTIDSSRTTIETRAIDHAAPTDQVRTNLFSLEFSVARICRMTSGDEPSNSPKTFLSRRV
jgi:hypothetical protein